MYCLLNQKGKAKEDAGHNEKGGGGKGSVLDWAFATYARFRLGGRRCE